MRESQLKASILKMIKREFTPGFLWKISDMWISGIPDVFGIVPTKYKFFPFWFFMEIKTETGKLSKIQEYIIGKIQNIGGAVYVVRSVDESRESIKKGIEQWETRLNSLTLSAK